MTRGRISFVLVFFFYFSSFLFRKNPKERKKKHTHKWERTVEKLSSEKKKEKKAFAIFFYEKKKLQPGSPAWKLFFFCKDEKPQMKFTRETYKAFSKVILVAKGFKPFYNFTIVHILGEVFLDSFFFIQTTVGNSLHQPKKKNQTTLCRLESKKKSQLAHQTFFLSKFSLQTFGACLYNFFLTPPLFHSKPMISSQTRVPGEFKHINQPEEKKLTRIPSVTASEAGRAQI